MSEERARQGQSRNRLHDVPNLNLDKKVFHSKNLAGDYNSKRLFDSPNDMIKV